MFGWALRAHDDGSLSFAGTVGAVSGMFVEGRAPATQAGFVISIMVADARAICDAIAAAGGTIVKPPDLAASEITAWFTDPGGNLMGIYEQSGLGA